MNNLVTPVREQPRLWIERVEIFGSIDPPELIRGIDFSKGLNIIWGVPNPERETEGEFGIEFNGHSVGKTSLCRLIRYALGESSFGRKIHERRINSTFRDKKGGAVAILVHIDGTQWSVIRPFQQYDTSKASRILSIKDLFTASHEDNSYGNFEKALYDAFIAPFPAHAPPGTEQEYVWPHLLAWLTRDQEARYQSIWQWRSTRSETRGIPLFSKRKFAAQHLMRTVLALLNDEEVKISKEIDICSGELKNIESQCAALTKAYEDKATYLESILLATLPQEEQALVDLTGNKPLFSLDNVLTSHLATLDIEISDTSKQREENQKELVFYQAEVSFYEKAIEHVRAYLEPLEDSANEPVDISSEDVKREKMEERLKNEQKCYWSGMSFDDCEHYKKSLQKLREKFSQIKKALSEIPDDNAKKLAFEKWVADEFKFTQKLHEAREQVERLIKEENRLAALISTKKGETKSIKSQNKSLQASMAFSKGIFFQETIDDFSVIYSKQHEDVQNIQELNKIIEQKNKTLYSLKTRLAQSQQWIWDQGDRLKQLYDRVLKNVLSKKLDANVTLPPKYDLHFGIQESTAVLSGEAIESLSLILFDITAVLWSVAGNGVHPCFLMHDSPREADLETPIYNQFLKNIHALSMSLGGKDAPFQYIVTTTSEPPEALQKDNVVKDKLCAHPPENMLFRKILEPPTLFGSESEQEQEDIDTIETEV